MRVRIARTVARNASRRRSSAPVTAAGSAKLQWMRFAPPGKNRARLGSAIAHRNHIVERRAEILIDLPGVGARRIYPHLCQGANGKFVNARRSAAAGMEILSPEMIQQVLGDDATS